MQSTLNPAIYKLIAFDIDGTLLGASHRLTPYTKSILARLRAKGIPYTINTGRNLPGIRTIADEMRIDQPMVLSNGSIIQTCQGKIIAQTCLPADAVKAAIHVCQAGNYDLLMYSGSAIYLREMNENIYPIYGHVLDGLYQIGQWETIADKFSGINKCVIVDTNNEQNLIDLEPFLRQSLDGRALTLRTSKELLEVQLLGVNKATGLEKLADHLGIRMQEIIAFGDYDNDAEMLKEAGLGIAVENATQACLDNADLLVASVDADGPAHFLEEFLFS